MKTISILILLLCGWLQVGCHKDNDDYFTTTNIVVQGGDTISVERIQATATLTNINTGRAISSADFQGNALSIDLLRGAYKVSIQGLIRYRDPQSRVHTRIFRAYSEFVSLADEKENNIMMNLFFMD